MAEIAVVIPCYNYGKYLDEAVESVLSQSFQDFEVVIVDDGSTDPLTCSLLSDYQRPKTRILRTERQGPAAARNAGIRATASRYVCNLDADDRLHPLYFEKTKAILDADTDESLGFVTTWLRRFGDDDQRWQAGAFSPLVLALTNNVHTSSLFRRRAWETVRGYRESMTGQEDWNLWLSMVAAGFRWEVIEEELYFYRKHGATRSFFSERKRPEIFETLLEANGDFYRRHHKELLATLYRKNYELEGVWREKHQALEDNEELQRQLTGERKSHRQALEEYRELEIYCRSLEKHVPRLEEKLSAEQKGKSLALAEYRKLEDYCRSLEDERREQVALIEQLQQQLDARRR